MAWTGYLRTIELNQKSFNLYRPCKWHRYYISGHYVNAGCQKNVSAISEEQLIVSSWKFWGHNYYYYCYYWTKSNDLDASKFSKWHTYSGSGSELGIILFMGSWGGDVILNQKALCVSRLSKGHMCNILRRTTDVILELSKHVIGDFEPNQKKVCPSKFVLRVYIQYLWYD